MGGKPSQKVLVGMCTDHSALARSGQALAVNRFLVVLGSSEANRISDALSQWSNVRIEIEQHRMTIQTIPGRSNRTSRVQVL